MKPWNTEDDRRLCMMAKAGWSIHMAAAQEQRLPYDIETRAEVLGLTLSDRTAGDVLRCPKCKRPHDEVCPYAATYCPRTIKFTPEAV